uniref:Uncharacterized protein n=1 Tax=Setaria digitata TaxID=48799 RepID=A0A915PLZ9_9BILA
MEAEEPREWKGESGRWGESGGQYGSAVDIVVYRCHPVDSDFPLLARLPYQSDCVKLYDASRFPAGILEFF